MKALLSRSSNDDQEKEKVLNVANVKGTEAFVLVSLVVGLFVLSLLTTVISLFIVIKLRLVPGSETITFSKDGNVVFNGETNLNKIHLYQNKIKGVSQLTGNIRLEAGNSYLNVNSKGIEIGSDEGFQVISPKTGKKIFPPDFNSLSLPSTLSSLSLPGGAQNVHKIRSPIDEDLNIASKDRVRIKGNEGVTIDGKQISLSSNGMFLSSVNGSVVLDAARGVVFKFDPNDIYPKKMDSSVSGSLQYKLCICSKSGRVFKLQMKTAQSSCADVRFPESINPCV
ncbi:Beta-sarcoglycan [Halotydeus destructor]|nr:Beta-sarcoglycan [Halotydeus destructor]